jgi:glycosyltransferase involved in cell wall biosynthesis
MRILLLAPHPFYQERGTPIAVDLLARALAERGDTVDILTYHEGDSPRDYPDTITIHRIAPPPFAHGIRPGFSIKKLICDAAMYKKAGELARRTRYDCIHAVEESVFMARRIGRQRKIPYIFDMDSSLPQQIAEKMPLAKPLLPMMHAFEARAIRDAAAIVPMCDALADMATAEGARYVEVLRDISLLPEIHTPNLDQGFRKALNLSGPTLLYIGNLERYQGIDLLLESFALAKKAIPEAHVVIAGGRDDDIQSYKAKTAELNLSEHVHFLGTRPLSHMADLFHDADILVSTRIQGNNTPMKIYSYLDADRAILATDLPTHTQILTPEVSLLVAPTNAAMATGMQKLLGDEALRRTLGGKARALARSAYSLSAFRAGVDRLYDHISQL